ncbi:MAG: hypothetical protein LBR26_17455 [Prevotella sp.]|jgi:hypothetical protein|nr:hypothetical protein [Prevotella sp.]
MRYKIALFLIGIIIIVGCKRVPKNGNQQEHLPVAIIPASESKSKPTINVYIENSASMDGYVGDNKTDFKTSVYSYLSDIQISDITNSLNLYYINSNIIPHRSDLSDFIEKLGPQSFRARGGNRGTTDISNMVDTIIKKTQETSLSILISDFIFSPGRGKHADQYLINQQIGIKTNIAKALKNRNLGIIVYQLSSEFKGRYYNREDRPTMINARRPFYIWIIGDKENVAKLHAEIPMSKFKGSGIENVFTIIRGNQNVDYAIRPGTGKFNLDRENSKTKIVKTKRDHNEKVTFAVDADFSELLLDGNYLKNLKNYSVSDKDYQLNITDSPANPYGYTNSLNFISDIIKSTNLSVKLKMNIPEWVEQMNDDIGLNINANDAMGKTYGIKYLINGVYEAFTKKENFYTEIKISINN